MKTEKISAWQFSIIIFFLVRSLFVFYTKVYLINTVRLDSIISYIVGVLLGIIILIIYYLIFNYKTKLTIYEKIKDLFTRTHLIIIIIYLINLILFLIIIFRKSSDYIGLNMLPNTNNTIIIISLIGLIFITANYGFETISRSSEIIFYLFMLTFILIMFGIFPISSSNNILPLLTNSFKSISLGSLYTGLFSIAPLFLLTIIPKNNVRGKINYLIPYLLGGLSLVIVLIAIISVLGINLSALYTYPEIVILKSIKYFNFIERLEVFLMNNWLYDLILLMTLIFYNIKEGIKYLIPSSNKYYSFIIIIIIFFCIILFNNKEILITNILIINFLMIPFLIGFKIICKTKKH